MLFDPRFLFGMLWGSQLVGHALFGGLFKQLDLMTVLTVIVMLLSFLSGSQLVEMKMAPQHRLLAYCDSDDTGYSDWIAEIGPFIIVIYCFFAATAFYLICTHLGIGDLLSGSYDKLRLALINDFTEGREVAGLLKVFFLGVGLSSYLLCFSRKMSPLRRTLLVVVGLLSAILTTGRLALLLLFLATSYILYSLRLIRVKGLIAGLAAFVVIFFAIAVLLQKGSDEGNLYQQIFWNVMVYYLGSLSTFDYYVSFGEPVIDGGALLPNPVRVLLSPLVGDLAPKPAVNPFVSNPIESNTYTAIFPVYHDAGLFGIIVFFFLLGCFHQFLYNKQKSSSMSFKYYYALSLYPLVMTIFEEAYVSSLGFWITFLVVPVIFRTLYRVWIKVPKSIT